MLENGVGHIREKWVGQLGENSGLKVGHFPENSQQIGQLKVEKDFLEKGLSRWG